MQILVTLFLLFSLFVQGCGLASGASGGDRGGGGGTPSGEIGVLTTDVLGFSPWGGIASSNAFRHLSDPAGIVSGSIYSDGGDFKGGSGVNPSEVLSQP